LVQLVRTIDNQTRLQAEPKAAFPAQKGSFVGGIRKAKPVEGPVAWAP